MTNIFQQLQDDDEEEVEVKEEVGEEASAILDDSLILKNEGEKNDKLLNKGKRVMTEVDEIIKNEVEKPKLNGDVSKTSSRDETSVSIIIS